MYLFECQRIEVTPIWSGHQAYLKIEDMEGFLATFRPNNSFKNLMVYRLLARPLQSTTNTFDKAFWFLSWENYGVFGID